jgi:MoxR-like ATPase
VQFDKEQVAFVRAFVDAHGGKETVTRKQIQELVAAGAPDPLWLWRGTEYRVGGGVYKIPEELLTYVKAKAMAASASLGSLDNAVEDVGTTSINTDDIKIDSNYAAFVPYEDPLYVPFGNYFDVETITESGEFFPYWIYGLSGNGKTLGIEQAHARLKKKLINVPITREADEDSLLGGLRIINGSTVPFWGPVTLGALLGCTVLLDETDLGDEKLMCLQTPLQNRPFLIKRLGKLIVPKPGFNLCATANTKGQGQADSGGSEGKFVGANIMNEAMLDRYITVFEQDYPGQNVEREILYKLLDSYKLHGPKEEQFVDRLLKWADKVRTSYNEQAISEVITTRRLVHIVRSYKMFKKDRKKAIERCIARFNIDTKTAFLDFYKAIDETLNTKEEEEKRVRAALETGEDPETGF